MRSPLLFDLEKMPAVAAIAACVRDRDKDVRSFGRGHIRELIRQASGLSIPTGERPPINNELPFKRVESRA